MSNAGSWGAIWQRKGDEVAARDTLSLRVAAPYRALVSESVERRLEQAADELDMDYALIT